MKRPPRRSKRAKDAEPASLRRRDKLQIAGLVLGMLIAIFAFEHYYWTRKAAAQREDHLRIWQRRYQLTEEQVDRLRVIEREFHGSGNPLLTPAHSAEEQRAHSRLLRETMNLREAPVEGPGR